MGEPLKNHFGAAIPRRIAEMIANVWPELNATEFVADALRGYEPLELKQRAEHIARVMHRHLPQDFAQAAGILLASLGPKLEGNDSGEHAHGAIEMFYVISGELEHVVNGKSQFLKPGMAGYVRPPDKIRHKTGPAGAKVVVIWVPGDEAKKIVARWTKEP
ncbi:MAG TPA: cupin domain-containing protein [Gemmatimonadaceae bacterium]|jgi:quercetin dioxygenase-like cupin family protein